MTKKKGLDGKACWKGYMLKGTKKKGGKTVDNCVKMKKAKKGVRINKKLTDRQLKTLERHKEHHTKKHMDMMIKLMQQGKTFTEAHNIAMDKVGK